MSEFNSHSTTELQEEHPNETHNAEQRSKYNEKPRIEQPITLIYKRKAK